MFARRVNFHIVLLVELTYFFILFVVILLSLILRLGLVVLSQVRSLLLPGNPY
jgi:hypothetical protein